MSINLVQWEGSTVTPKLDAIMYDDGSYGIIKGCAITHQGTNLLKIANGFIKIAGRLIEIAEETIQCQVSASGTVNGQLWLRLDLNSVTPAVFMTEAAAVLTPLTQNADCNFSNGIYELQLATYNIDESVITNLVETAPELERLRTALENIDLDASNVTYHSTTVEAELDEINDNLNGFKFYPTGTQLVAYIEGHGWYNTDGKYVIWGTATANALVEASPNTYYGRPSEEDLRGEVGADTATPFKSVSEVNNITAYNNTNSGFVISDAENNNMYILTITMQTNGSPDFNYINIASVTNAEYELLKQTSITFYGGSSLRSYLLKRTNRGNITISFTNNTYSEAKMVSLCAVK